MHEFSIATGIVNIAEEYARNAGAGSVHEIELEIGTMSGVMIQALEFALDVAVKGTILEDAKRITRVVEAKGMCTNCSAVFGVKDFFATCPECKQTGFKLLKGRELRVKSILIG